MPHETIQYTDRFRKTFRPLTEHEANASDAIKDAAESLVNVIENAAQSGLLKDPRYKALALTDVESAVMWAVKGITA